MSPVASGQGREPLTDFAEAFCQAYAASGNATRACLAAGYAGTPHAASAKAARLLKKPEVARRVAALRARPDDPDRVSPDALIDKLLRVYELATDPNADPKRYTGRDATEAVRAIAQLTGAADAHRRSQTDRKTDLMERRLELERERNDLLGKAQQIIVQIPGVARPDSLTPGAVVAVDDYRVDGRRRGR